MHKLVILIEAEADPQVLEDGWPRFIRQSEQMPGLQRVATSTVEHFLYGTGSGSYQRLHELFFNSLGDLQRAMASAEGKATGRILQEISGGRLALFIAEHKQDDLENIRKYHPKRGQDE